MFLLKSKNTLILQIETAQAIITFILLLMLWRMLVYQLLKHMMAQVLTLARLKVEYQIIMLIYQALITKRLEVIKQHIAFARHQFMVVIMG